MSARSAAGALCAALLALSPAGAAAAATIDTSLLQGLGDVRYHQVESRATEHLYHVYVRLPEGYASDEDRRFPTVYLLDGGVTFPLVSGYYRYLSLGGEIPAAILVGIAYGTDDWRNGNNRSRDYTAPATEREHWGGAPEFQDMLRDELQPLIEATYRSDPRRRVIFGQSIGGQFVLFTASTEPGLFWGHIASNPALHRNLPFFLRDRPVPAGAPRTRLFVSSGADDEPEFREPALSWMEHWSGRDSAPWVLETVILPGQTHFSAAPAAFRRGMSWLFAAE